MIVNSPYRKENCALCTLGCVAITLFLSICCGIVSYYVFQFINMTNYYGQAMGCKTSNLWEYLLVSCFTWLMFTFVGKAISLHIEFLLEKLIFIETMNGDLSSANKYAEKILQLECVKNLYKRCQNDIEFQAKLVNGVHALSNKNPDDASNNFNNLSLILPSLCITSIIPSIRPISSEAPSPTNLANLASG